MRPLFEKASGLAEAIIAGAIEVHRDKGSGLIESRFTMETESSTVQPNEVMFPAKRSYGTKVQYAD